MSEWYRHACGHTSLKYAWGAEREYPNADPCEACREARIGTVIAFARHGAGLRGANLRDADLSGVDLTEATVTGANLVGAYLSRATLSDVRIDLDVPEVPHLDSAILAALAKGGTLTMDTWHSCATTHCRAGWAITLAGAAGAALEERLGSCAAGALIYHVSARYVPDFYASETLSLADIQAHAAAE
jgi:hypothetical protein